MANEIILGLKAQDFHESLKNHSIYGPKEVHFKKTLLIGKAASLAMHLRGLIYIQNYQQLEYAAATLGIGSLELPSVLRELEELDFISIMKSGEKIKRVDIRVPTFRSGYQELGERWKQLEPSTIEKAGIVTLNQLQQEPVVEENFKNGLGIEPNEMSIMIDVMDSGLLIARETINGVPFLYSPLAVDQNPTKYLYWASKFPGEIQEIIHTLTNFQGLPIEHEKAQKNQAFHDAIMTGVLMPVEVIGATGSKRFVFAPHGGLSQEERIIMDKARAIVASVRYGQHYAKGRPIKYPELILSTLRDKKKFSKGHPDLISQYGILAEKFIGHPFQEKNGYWNFEIDDTDENIKALDIAIEMVKHGSVTSSKIDLDAKNALLGSSGFQGPPTARPALRNAFKGSPEIRQDIIKKMGEIMRGGYSND